MKLVKQLQEGIFVTIHFYDLGLFPFFIITEEVKADLAITQLLNLNRETFKQFAQQQQIEDERLLLITTPSEDLRRNDILEAMQAMLEKEAANFKQYDKNREETTRTVLLE